MALVRVAQYNSTPTVVGDYQAQNAHLQAFTNQLLTQQFILDGGTDQPVIKQGCYVSHGGSLYVADADTSIAGSPADGSVYIRVSGSTSLTVEFVTDISGYAWNPVYTALTSTTYTLLPYLIVKASAVWTRYNFNPNNQSFGDTRLKSLAVTGAISGASLNTGSGAFTFNQGVKTTDSPTFVNVNAKVNDAQFYAGGAKKGTMISKTNGTEAEWYNSLLGYLPSIGDRILVSGYITEDSTSQRIIVSCIERGSNHLIVIGMNIDGGSNIFLFVYNSNDTFSGAIVL